VSVVSIIACPAVIKIIYNIAGEGGSFKGQGIFSGKNRETFAYPAHSPDLSLVYFCKFLWNSIKKKEEKVKKYHICLENLFEG
jgi:hypothetical protein